MTCSEMRSGRLVLLHGVGLDHTMWQPLVAQLPRDAVVWAPDLPGHGDSAPVPSTVTLAELADPIATGLRPGDHLVGFSLGALIAQFVARFHPDLVATLTSVSSVCLRSPDERASVLYRMATATAEFPLSVEASLDRWYADTDVSAETVERTRATLLANDVESYLSCYRVFATADEELAPELAHITAPSLAITGRLDPGSTPAMTRRLAATIPDCRAIVVPGARHMLPVQNPRAVGEAVTDFLGEITRV